MRPTSSSQPMSPSAFATSLRQRRDQHFHSALGPASAPARPPRTGGRLPGRRRGATHLVGPGRRASSRPARSAGWRAAPLLTRRRSGSPRLGAVVLGRGNRPQNIANTKVNRCRRAAVRTTVRASGRKSGREACALRAVRRRVRSPAADWSAKRCALAAFRVGAARARAPSASDGVADPPRAGPA